MEQLKLGHLKMNHKKKHLRLLTFGIRNRRVKNE